MKMYAIRGATTVTVDTQEELKNKSVELFVEIIKANNISRGDIVSLTASNTNDIKCAFPVKFVRESNVMSDIVLFSCQEPDITGGLKMCVRYLLHIQKDGEFKPKHIYMHGAKILRKDLVD